MPTNNVRALEPKRYYYTDRFKVTAFNSGTKVATLVNDMGETYLSVLDQSVVVNQYYVMGLEERVFENPDNANAITQYADVIQHVTSPPIDTFVNLSDTIT